MSERGRPFVTIGLCTYNRADTYLPAALQSAADQIYPHLEIVVADNNSTDGTRDVVMGFSDPRIRYLRQEENIGPVNNYNSCLAQARGDYFLLLHDDDLIDPDMVAACMDAVGTDTSVGLIRTGTRVIDGIGRIIGEKTNDAVGLSTTDFFRAWFDNKTPIYLCSTIHNASRLKELGGFRSRKNLYPDTAVALQLAGRFGRVDVPEVRASFRIHGSNSGDAARLDDWCEDALYLLDVMCELVPDDAPLIRREGLNYFSKRNYVRAGAIGSFSEWGRACWQIYRRFDYAYSPWRHFSLTRMKRLSELMQATRSRLAMT